MSTILLIFDDIKELALLEDDLSRNGFQILKSSILKDALKKTEGTIPNLIVINTSDSENEIEQQLSKQTKTKYQKRKLFPGLIGLEGYLDLQTLEYTVIKSLLRNKKYTNDKAVFFISQNAFPAFHN